MRVCLVIEGSYPFITGGVSSWVHDLITGLPQIEFSLFTFSPEADQKVRYALPPNVVEHRDVVLSRRDAALRSHDAPPGATERVLAAHASMYAGSAPDLLGLIGTIAEGSSFHDEAMLDPRAWRLVQSQNRSHNPLYPFSDYFWAWKSSHDLIFNVLGARPPDADLYHSVSTGFAGLAALAAKIRRGTPFLLTEHGLYHKEREIEIRKATFVRGYQRDMWTRFYNKIAALCYANADLCTSLFEENRKKQIELGALPERTVVIPNGIDMVRFSVQRSRRDDAFHVGFIGRIVPIKDVKTFLVAAKLLLERVPDSYFHLVGPDDEDEAYAKECRALAVDLKIEDRTEFTGRKDVREYYSFLDVVALTSVREAQPLVILEAYAAGIPVVSTDVGNVSELLEEDRRFMAAVKDPAGIAAALAYVHDNPEAMQLLAERNRARTLASYDKAELLARYGSLYERFSGGTTAASSGSPLAAVEETRSWQA